LCNFKEINIREENWLLGGFRLHLRRRYVTAYGDDLELYPYYTSPVALEAFVQNRDLK
jgi:hypothetical protein